MKITCRLVPDQQPEEVAARVRRHLEAHVPPGTRLSLSIADHGSRAAHIRTDHFALKAAVFFSFSTADEDFHAPNEFFRVHRLHEGLEAWARYWAILGEANA